MADLTLEDLGRLYKPMSPIVKAKVLDRVDPHGAKFISLSPFVVVSAAGPDGAIDVSPRGGEPGFVKLEEMVMDQLGMGKPPVSNAVILDRYREQL